MSIPNSGIVINPAPFFREYAVQINGKWHWVSHISGQGEYKGKEHIQYGIKHHFEIRPCESKELPELVKQFIKKYLVDGEKEARFVVFNKKTEPPAGAKEGWVKV